MDGGGDSDIDDRYHCLSVSTFRFSDVDVISYVLTQIEDVHIISMLRTYQTNDKMKFFCKLILLFYLLIEDIFSTDWII